MHCFNYPDLISTTRFTYAFFFYQGMMHIFVCKNRYTEVRREKNVNEDGQNIINSDSRVEGECN